MGWQRGPLKVVILTKMVMLTKKSEKSPKPYLQVKWGGKESPQKSGEYVEKSQRRLWRRWQICRKWLKFAKGFYKTSKIVRALWLAERSVCMRVCKHGCRVKITRTYILLNEIQTMFSQLAKRSASVLPADLYTDHAHYVKNHRSTVLRRNKNMAVEGGTVSHYFIFW